jgi:Methyltransferase domain
MLPHWGTVIRPFLSTIDRGPLIEIGAAEGDTTAKLATLAVERDVVLHSIDPAPQFDVAEYERRFGPHFRFHEARSHEVLERIGPAAAVLIDGDHNWYTVHGELILLERIARAAARHLPLVLLHDMEWPYARRDMYHEPQLIPKDLRKPWARRGIEFGRVELLDTQGRGLNPKVANAIEEGGPCNGVLTAVEDFRRDASISLQLRIVRGEFGLGVLAADDLLASSQQLRDLWESMHSTRFFLAEAERLSRAATVGAFQCLELVCEVDRLKRSRSQPRSDGIE